MIKAFKYIACCLVGVLALLPLQAQNIIRPKIAGPGNLWVNSYNGVLFFEQTDFETQNSAMPMQLRFYYNSSASSVDYGYGLGFSMGYEMRYREDVTGGVDIETGDGRCDHFIKYGDEYMAPAGVFSTLTRPSFGTYLFTTKEGKKYFFDDNSHRKVTAIEDRYGNKTTFKYQDTLLVEVKDAVGHTISLNYTDGLLTQASSTFSPGKYKYEYDGLRRLRKRIDPMGNVTIYDYSRHNKLNEITDANGNKTHIAYNDAGMVSRLKTDVSDKSIRYDGDKTIFIDYTEPNNVYSYYRWDDKGHAIEKVGLCCGIQSTQKYDDNDNVSQLIDANGNITTFTYDEHGNLLSSRDPLGYTEQYTYEPHFNQVASYCDKNGNTFTFNYDTKGSITSMTGPLGLKNQYMYDEHGWLTMTTDSNNGVTQTTYNSDGTKASVMNADGSTINYYYDSYGRLSSATDAMGNTTSYTYDELGHVISWTDALGNTTRKNYDKVGNLVRFIDASGHITSYTYNALGKISSVTNSMGFVTTYEYDGRNNIIAIVDPMEIRKELTYNDRNKIDSFTNGAGEKTNYDYDIKGNLIAVMYPNGNIVSYDYDELDRVVEINDNIGLIAVIEYDGNGNRISITDGLGRKLSYTYDALNRQTSEILPSGAKTFFEYDNNGNVVVMKDALGHITNFEYDQMNRLTTHKDASNAKTEFSYDSNGNLTRIIDAMGNATTYSYDALNQNTVITFANGRSLQYTYDELGRIIATKDRAGNEIKYDYNSIGRLLTKTYPDGSTDRYAYDKVNRLLSAVNQNAEVTFAYDRTGRLLRETLNDKTTTYSYDVAGCKRQITYPSGMNIIENLNNRNLISNIVQDGNEVVNISYNASGQKISQAYANGITTEYGYNENGWLTTIKDNHNTLSYVISYDAIGNITERTDLLNDEFTEKYKYNNTNQLISFIRGSSVNLSYDYDVLGNRISSTENGTTTYYTSDNVNAYHKVTGIHDLTFQYDGNGNMLYDGVHLYAYDFNNRLKSVDGTDCIYKYDALGRRISKNNISFYYVGQQMIEQHDGVVSSFLYGDNIDEIFQLKQNENSFYYQNNHIGSTQAISSNNGSIIERVEYNAFGVPTYYDENYNTIEHSTIDNSILFSGREYEKEYGLYFYRSRYYNPSYGRFLQKDTKGYINGLNDYQYVRNNPILFVDPYGYAQKYRAPLKALERILGKCIAKKMMDWSEKQEWMDKYNVGLYHEQWFYDDYSRNVGYGDNKDNPRMSEEDITRYHPVGRQYSDGDLETAVRNNSPENYGRYHLTPHWDSWKFWKWYPSHNCQAWAEEIEKELDNNRDHNSNDHPKKSCDSSTDPPCRYDPCTGGFDCQVSY